MGKKVYYMETYLASEGFLAYQHHLNEKMRLVMDNGIYFEFVPFTSKNFTPEGELVKNPEILDITGVKENEDYAILLSTVSGAWRYLIGDTIRFLSLETFEILITGRTKHFISLCGEHLSVDNMNKAVSLLADELDIKINEFTVAGISHENLFAHKWYLGIGGQCNVSVNELKEKLDNYLKSLNDDYAVERKAALKEIYVEVVPEEAFYGWMRKKGKEGGQHKFPRVIYSQYNDWEQFIRNYRA
jgi:hypothetical protein